MTDRNQYQRKAHDEIEQIFRRILPKHGLGVREEQVQLSHEMLEALLGGRITLCDAGVGIGKTYAYLAACTVMQKCPAMSGNYSVCDERPVAISTSSIALQDAIMQEYIPFLSRALQEAGMIHEPLKAVVRKGKEHFVCDNRLRIRLSAIQNKQKNEKQKQALLSLRKNYDMDQVHGLSGFDRRLVCVPKFCPGDCQERETCRYQRYLKQAKRMRIHFQICNHNYLLADATHRKNAYRPLLSDYRALVVDEAHKLPEAARQMYSKTLCYEDILEICYFLTKEHKRVLAMKLKGAMQKLFSAVGDTHSFEQEQGIAFQMTEESAHALKEGSRLLQEMRKKLKGNASKWILSRLKEYGEVLGCFLAPDRKHILHLSLDSQHFPVLYATSRRTPELLSAMLWDRGFPAILTSGTLKAGNGFGRTRQAIGLEQAGKVQEYVAESPFQYKENCMLYLPQGLREASHGSRTEAELTAKHIERILYATHGHALVLFTSYALMGNVCQILRDRLPFPMVEVWKHAQKEILRFKTMENAALFAAGTCWEGVDFPGDIVSSLIIVKLPFAVPDPVSESERERYGSLKEYIEAVVVPDMQKKLRQGFGRAIRTEQDTCVVSILDSRAAAGGRYHEDVLCALPPCQRAESIEDVESFILRRKRTEYYI